MTAITIVVIPNFLILPRNWSDIGILLDVFLEFDHAVK
jgi:hypothetical protein